MLELPYQGFTWSITQHIGPGTDPRVLFNLLDAAYVFPNNKKGQIDNRLTQQGVLTENVRDGRSQPWRDYQQVLPELGLMISSRVGLPKLVLTPAGMLLLEGSIGISELITTQCLRFQYPNAHKDQFPKDVQSGVYIKPGVLMLRVLLSLLDSGDPDPGIDPHECLTTLVPVRSNSGWAEALEQLGAIRGNRNASVRDKTRLRHVQEWFRLLARSDLFYMREGSNKLGLTQIAIQNKESLESLCLYHEDRATFWCPSSDDRSQMAMSWFDHFGSPDISSQWLLPEDQLAATPKYLEKNYLAENREEGLSDGSEVVGNQGSEIKLQSFMPSRIAMMPGGVSSLTPDEIKRIQEGRGRSQKSACLHEHIVAMVAEKFKAGGYKVQDDPQSVDLLASRSGKETIVEVKTVTKRNISSRIRLGVGQLSEYRYRREIQKKNRPNGILVLSSDTTFDPWVIGFFKDDLRLGLVSLRSSTKFIAHTVGKQERVLTGQ